MLPTFCPPLKKIFMGKDRPYGEVPGDHHFLEEVPKPWAQEPAKVEKKRKSFTNGQKKVLQVPSIVDKIPCLS